MACVAWCGIGHQELTDYCLSQLSPVHCLSLPCHLTCPPVFNNCHLTCPPVCHYVNLPVHLFVTIISPYLSNVCHNNVILPVHCLSQLCHLICPTLVLTLSFYLFFTAMSPNLSTCLSLLCHLPIHYYCQVTLPVQCFSLWCHLICPLFVIIMSPTCPPVCYHYVTCPQFVTTISPFLSTVFFTLSPYLSTVCPYHITYLSTCLLPPELLLSLASVSPRLQGHSPCTCPVLLAVAPPGCGLPSGWTSLLTSLPTKDLFMCRCMYMCRHVYNVCEYDVYNVYEYDCFMYVHKCLYCIYMYFMTKYSAVRVPSVSNYAT